MIVPGPLPGFASLVIALLSLSCAGQVAPSGGPPDTTPPQIVRTVPDTNAVRVETDRIELEFSEYVERRSLEESIFISPYLGDLEFDWSGREVVVRFPEKLRKNTTYVVNVGTDVVDVRSRNRMGTGFTLAFATGDSLDRGAIDGRVYDAKPEGVMIFAYALAGINPDTLNPSHVRPDYIMQTGKNGRFALSNLAYGRYRLIAVRDEYRNLIYDKEVDQYGVGRGDISIDPQHPRVDDILFRISKEDTTRPFVVSASAVNRRQIEVRFSEPIDSLSVLASNFVVLDTVTRVPRALIGAFPHTSSPSLVGLITRDPLDSAGAYKVLVRGVADRAANGLDSLHSSAAFAGSNTPDTVRATVTLVGIRDSARAVVPDQPFVLSFSEPVSHDALLRAIVLRDSLRRTVASSLRWTNATDAILTFERPLLSKAWYALSIVMDSVRDLRGGRFHDSIRVTRFETLDLRMTGSIEGTVVDDLPPPTPGTYVLTASSIDQNPAVERTVRVDKPGKFSVDMLTEGRYTIEGYQDSDGSGSYSYGRPFPFLPSERFTQPGDTLKVRARWTAEGVKVEFRK
jgi:Bacterial Ig-like domain